MNLRDCKILTLALLAPGSFLAGLATLPLGRRLFGGRRERESSLTSSLLLLCCGAGALLATSVLHVLPHTRLVLDRPGQQLGITFLPELLISSGFFLIYILEEVVELVAGLAGGRATQPLERSVSVRRSARLASTVTVAGAECCQDNDMQRREEGEEGLEGEGGEDETDGNTNSSFNPKYSVKLSQSTNTMFPNYHSPDSIIVLQSTELKRKSSVRSQKTPKLTSPDQTEPASERVRSPGTLRDLLLGKTPPSL